MVKKLTAIVVRGTGDLWTRECNPAEIHRKLGDITVSTMQQRESDQYLIQRGFKRG